MDRPWFQFWARDWLDNKELRRCSGISRAVLADLMCLAHEGTPYGYLADKIGPLTEKYMAGRCSITLGAFKSAVRELLTTERLKQDESGALYVPRMVRDEEIRLARATGGYQSPGNPKLTTAYNAPGFVYMIRRSSDGAVKIGIAKSPQSRMWKLKSQHRPDILEELATIPVEDMGTSEASLHARFADKKVIGEWFELTAEDVKEVATSFKGSTLKEVKDISRARMRADSDSDSSGSHVVLGGGPGGTEMHWSVDEGYQPFVAAYREARPNTLDDEFADALFPWRLLAFDQRLQATRGVVQRVKGGIWRPGEPQFVMPPAKYLQREWKREVIAPTTPTASKSDAKSAAVLRRIEEQNR